MFRWGILAIVAVANSLPNESGEGGRIDLTGGVLIGLAMGSFILCLGSAPFATSPVDPARILLGGAILLLGAFLVRQRHARNPVLPLEIFASRRFSLAVITSFSCFTSQGMAIIALGFLLQEIHGFTLLQTGLLFMSWPTSSAMAALFSGRMADRSNPRMLATFGTISFGAGLMALAFMPADAMNLDIVWRAALTGFGFGFFQSPNNRELLGSLDRKHSGKASGMMAATRTLAQALGGSIVGVILSTGEPSDVIHALWIATGLMAAVSVLGCIELLSARASGRSGPSTPTITMRRSNDKNCV